MFQAILRMILGQTNIYNRIIQFEEKNIRLFIKSKHTFNNLKTTREHLGSIDLFLWSVLRVFLFLILYIWILFGKYVTIGQKLYWFWISWNKNLPFNRHVLNRFELRNETFMKTIRQFIGESIF